MSHELHLAVAMPAQPLLLAIPVVLFLIVAVILVRKRKAKKRSLPAAWHSAAEELGLQLGPTPPKGDLTVRGRLNDHVVSIAPVPLAKGRVATRYTVKFEAPEAPKFTLGRRTDAGGPKLNTGNPKFDAVVVIQTDQPALLARFLTGPRRAAILRLLTYWPTAEITNRTATLTTNGVEAAHDKLVDSVCHLVAAAETFDRPTVQVRAPGHDVSPPEEGQAVGPVETGVGPAAGPHGGSEHGDVMTEIRLDEQSVLKDLFDSGLNESGIAERFQNVYRGKKVSWTGEVLRVGTTEEGRQRIAALIGSADGQDPESGRVVALTSVGSDPILVEGDVVGFSGSLVNLDAGQRLFHVL